MSCNCTCVPNGTPSFLPKFDVAGTCFNTSQVYDSGTVVSIGSQDPNRIYANFFIARDETVNTDGVGTIATEHILTNSVSTAHTINSINLYLERAGANNYGAAALLRLSNAFSGSGSVINNGVLSGDSQIIGGGSAVVNFGIFSRTGVKLGSAAHQRGLWAETFVGDGQSVVNNHAIFVGIPKKNDTTIATVSAASITAENAGIYLEDQNVTTDPTKSFAIKTNGGRELWTGPEITAPQSISGGASFTVSPTSSYVEVNNTNAAAAATISKTNAVAGQRLTVANVGTQTFTFTDDANQSSSGGAATVAVNRVAEFIYSATIGKWLERKHA